MMTHLNEMRKLAGLPEKAEQLNEAGSTTRLRQLAGMIDTLSSAFKKDGNLAKGLKADDADMSYFDDISKALGQMEDDMQMLQRSIERMDNHE